MEEVSSATVRTCVAHCAVDKESSDRESGDTESTGFLLTSKIERTARLAAMATSGMMTRSGTVV